MSTERLLDVLTEIRDQQKRQIENFERAIERQSDSLELQRKSRQTFQFLVYAPWVALALMCVYLFVSGVLLGS
jgi:hypothetical protein